jgi:chitinase
VEVAKDGVGDKGWVCVFGRNKVFCCDPPVSDSAFLPVALTDLFPETFATSAVPEYDLALGTGYDEDHPLSNPEPDPDTQTFSWIVMVADDEDDLTSLRRRDGSDLELFDCPDVHPSDYSVQKLRAVCLAADGVGNCEKVLSGGAEGTIVRLPEKCTPDHHVRVVSFAPSTNRTLPGHLVKRDGTEAAKVYDLHFDYNFRE